MASNYDDAETGGPAFARPTTKDIHGYGEDGSEGMSLRDYFAAKVMATLVGPLVQEVGLKSTGVVVASVEKLATTCYYIADVMLEEREK